MSEDMLSSSVSRRTAMKGAAVAAGLVWVAPVVQFISMDSASAASGAPGGVLGGDGNSQGGDNRDGQGGNFQGGNSQGGNYQGGNSQGGGAKP